MARDEKSPVTSGPSGRFSYDGLDRVMHEKARLGILSSLAVHEAGLLFSDLRKLCSLTDGNLNRHLAVLNDAGLIETWKGPSGSRPQTLYRLSDNGRRQFADYISLLDSIVANARPSEKQKENVRSSEDGCSPA